MGLDLTNFMISLEDAFCLRIPDKDAQDLYTPRQVIDYLHRRLPKSSNGFCMSQRAFYRLRDSLSRWFDIDRSLIRSETNLLTVLPEPKRDEKWILVGEDLGVRFWPKLRKCGFGWFENVRSPRLSHVCDIIQFVVGRNTKILIDPDQGWTRSQVAEVFKAVVLLELGVSKNSYHEDARFVEDWGFS